LPTIWELSDLGWGENVKLATGIIHCLLLSQTFQGLLNGGGVRIARHWRWAMADTGHDRADIEQVFNKYLQSINAADVVLASQVWWLSPDVLVVTPIGRFKGWEGVKDIYAKTQREFSERDVQASNINIVVAGDAAWLFYDFVFTAKRAGQPFTSTGWESHGYLRTPNGWRIANLHYSVPPPA
jgi:ketosteroid isomerase-like protein